MSNATQINLNSNIYNQAQELAATNHFAVVSDYIENLLQDSLKREAEMAKLQQAIALGVNSEFLDLDEKFISDFERQR